jgi:NTE family protein
MKVGLALSGGGFRAAFFHLGVLARMAELGLLRHVEVISTVSGGSIVGALYYVGLKRLLEAKADTDVSDGDYIGLVARLEPAFSAAVQKNIRMLTFVNPWKNLQMLLPNYSRSDRFGELLDTLLYRPALDPARRRMIEMRELKIHPLGGPPDFHPRRHNEARRARVPILLLNATTLNTGHKWRFEASTMGPPPRTSPAALEVDKNQRLLRPPSYADVTPRQQNVELGLAVAASACVPGIFHPLALSGLYDKSIRVQLVDGGVHDNQGIQGLLDERCTHLIVSDASGQMDNEPDPATGTLSVLVRSNDILMDRLREEQLFGLVGGGARPSALLHLRKGLAVESVAWIDQHGQPARAGNLIQASTSASFGVDPEVQYLLSRIRTDLDSFTDTEAYSLMLDGYLMSGSVLGSHPGLSSLIPADLPAQGRWRFLELQRQLAHPTKPYLEHLSVGKEQLFKVFRLSPTTTVITVLAALLVAWLLWRWQGGRIRVWWNTPLTVGQVAIAVGILALGFIPWASRFLAWLRFLRSPAEYLLRLFIRGVVPALGGVFVWLYLQVFNRLFVWLGRVDRLR